MLESPVRGHLVTMPGPPMLTLVVAACVATALAAGAASGVDTGTTRGASDGRSAPGLPIHGGRGATTADLRAQARPNIILMLSDDQSWSGTSVPMHPDLAGSFDPQVETPALERMASEGRRFSAAYAPAPVCSPTRASLLTGRSPAALHWTRAGGSVTARSNPRMLPPQSERDLRPELTTVAEVLADAGYATAHFGKWHLGGGGPERHGFETSDGDVGNEAASTFSDPNPVDIFGMAERAESFMRSAAEADRPFFVQLSWLALHGQENALDATRQKYEQRGLRGRRVGRAALTEDLDTGVGRILDAVDRLGLRDRTYVIYMSDNGGTGGGGADDATTADRAGSRAARRARRGVDAPALAGGKGRLLEGGIRVPFIVRGPGIEPGSWSSVPVVGFDLYPTFVEWAGLEASVPIEVRDRLEGGSLVAVMSGASNEVDRPADELVFHFPHYLREDGPHSVLRRESMKLIRYDETGRLALFDLEADPGETNDLAPTRPTLAAALERRLDERLDALGAELATENAEYDPTRPSEVRRGGRRDRSESSPARQRRRPRSPEP